MKINLQLNTSPERSRRTYNILSNLLFYLSILIFLIGFNFSDNPPPSGWYQQFMPDLGGRQISDVFFLDSLTGWAVTPFVTQNDTTYVLKTTNGGDNWFIQFTGTGQFVGRNKVHFINAITGFTCGNDHFSGSTKITKTTDGGNSWFSLNDPTTAVYDDMYVLNVDTIWLVSSSNPTGGVFRTTNGGASWDHQLNLGSQNPTKIYMYNGRIGFISSTAGLYKTTNGTNWSFVSNDFSFSDMFFVDSLTGWKASGYIKKTTNGGLNWINQIIPTGGNILGSGALEFMNVDNDTIWAVGESLITGGSPNTRGILFRTVNSGNNWLFQLPDTSIHLTRYLNGQFINSKIGWAYALSTGIHTTTGGDPIWYTGIQQTPNAVPEGFVLKQNYPNPFNPRTVIPYSLSSSAHVKIIAYDITGREVQRMVDSYQQAGAYEVDFMGKFTATGVYFYRMTVTNAKSHQVYTDTKKMILIK